MILSLTAIFSCTLSMTVFTLILFWIVKKNSRLEKLGILNTYIFAIFILVRGYLPFDFYKIHLTKTYFSTKIIPTIQDIYAIPVITDGKKSISIINLILFIWIAIACYFGIKKIKGYLSYWKTLKNVSSFTCSQVEEIYRKASYATFPKKEKNCKIIILHDLPTPVVFGQIHPIILLPNISYSKEELYYIFLHELLHIKHRDFILKIFCDIISIIYWWNPFISRLFPSLMKQLQELYVDYDISKSLNNQEKLPYLNAIRRTVMHSMDLNSQKPDFLYSFCSVNPNVNIMQRLFFITQPHLKKLSKKAILLCFVLLLFSLSFVFEGWSILPEDETGTFTIEEDGNNFLIQNDDGTYECYIDGISIGDIIAFKKDDLIGTFPIYQSIEEAYK